MEGGGGTPPTADPWAAMDAEQLRVALHDAARLWLAHDGLWFQAVEQRDGMAAAIECDQAAWARFSPLEARRILARLGREPGGGLTLLAAALDQRLYSLINRQSIERPTSRRLIFRMLSCRVQDARRRKGLDDFPCRSVGEVEYTTFAETIDPRIRTRCLSCPPDPRRADCVCAWEFTLEEEAGR